LSFYFYFYFYRAEDLSDYPNYYNSFWPSQSWEKAFSPFPFAERNISGGSTPNRTITELHITRIITIDS